MVRRFGKPIALGILVGCASLVIWTWIQGWRHGPVDLGVSGQGKHRYRVLYRSDHLPPAARSVLADAHGGFAVDRRPGHGEVYFALPGAGIVQLSADLGTVRILDTEPAMKSQNLHNTTIWYDGAGGAHLSFPANDAGFVYTTDLEGRLEYALARPSGAEDLGSAVATSYFEAAGAFVPTDVAHRDGLLYITTGYSALDMVLTARADGTGAAWNPLAFGGKGTGPGQFGNGHGIALTPDGEGLVVADRPHAELDRFTPAGEYRATQAMPEGSFPCDADYLDDLLVVPSLHAQNRYEGAPIYIFEGDQLVSTVRPRQELGLAGFRHVHHAVLVRRGGRLYLLALAWNPGDFAVLEQVLPSDPQGPG